MDVSDLATRLPAAPTGWERHVDATEGTVEYRRTVGAAALAKLTVHTTHDGCRLAIKRGCRTVDERTVETAAAAAEAADGVLDDAGVEA